MFIDEHESNMISQQGQAITEVEDHDRRYLPRWDVRNKVLYCKENDRNYCEGLSKNISATGVCIASDNKIDSTHNVSLKIYLPDNVSPVHASGQIVWQKTIGQEECNGIHFEWIDKKALDLIFDYAFEYKREELRSHWFKGC